MARLKGPNITPAPAFIHVDVDDLWAVAECYGLQVPPELHHEISRTALPQMAHLFDRLNVKATFFIVGRDLETPAYRDLIRSLLDAGHRVANHSTTHRLDFRALSPEQLRHEISTCHNLAQDSLGVQMQGFRAPGYAASSGLTSVLQDLGYRYDASVMPSPWGFVFRTLDKRLQRAAKASLSVDAGGAGAPSAAASGETGAASAARKTQYPLLRDAFTPLSPAPLPPHAAGAPSLLRLPSATTPLLRLPFQAGVCMRLGWNYFRAGLAPYRRDPYLPLVFLFHAADLADFSQIPLPFFQNSPFFSTPLSQRLALAEQFLAAIRQAKPVTTTEEWLH